MPFDGKGFKIDLTRIETKDLAILREARDEIAKPRAWCSGSVERQRKNGQVSRCIMGWLMWIDNSRANQIAQEYLGPIVSKRIGIGDVVSYNDTHRKPNILSLFNEAIANLENR